MNIVRSIIRLCYIIESSPELDDQPTPLFEEFLKNKVKANAEPNGGADARTIYD